MKTALFELDGTLVNSKEGITKCVQIALSFFNKLKLKTDVFREMYSAIMDTLVVSTDAFESISFLDKVLFCFLSFLEPVIK